MSPKPKISLLHVVLISIATINIIALVLFVYLAISSQVLANLNYISVASTFSVAILTILYVFTTDNQLRIMKSQLDEMEKEHLFKDQPILLLDNTEFIIECPRFFYSPPEDEFSFFSRFFFNAKLINTCNDPAIVIRLDVKIIVPNGNQTINFRSFVEKFNFASSSYKAQQARFMFIEDKRGALFDALRDNKTITLQTILIYQNTSGACFKLINSYSFNISTISRAYDLKDAENTTNSKYSVREILANWHSVIVQAPTMYKEKVSEMTQIVHDTSKWGQYKAMFTKVEDAFNAQLKERNDLKVNVYEDNDTFEFKTISKEEFSQCPDNRVYFEDLINKSKQTRVENQSKPNNL